MGSKIGVLKIAASRIGIPFQDYLLMRDFGYKWCISCKSWKPVGEYNFDKSRGDGRKASCKKCDRVDRVIGPRKHERIEMKEKGLKWCRMCEDWLPIEDIRGGLCKPHINEDYRNRYNSDPKFRYKVRNRVYQRSKYVTDVPPEGQEIMLENFNGCCAYCDNPASTWDHIIPVIQGGNTTPGNIVPACKTCNSSKHAKDVFEWMEEKGIEPKVAFFERIMIEDIFMYHR